jgi:glycosyltransferase involved in cell wall biosynthesis
LLKPPLITDPSHPRHVLYLTVLPNYRQYCVDELLRLSDGSVQMYAGRLHTDSSIRTGISESQYEELTNHFFLKRKILLQTGHWRAAMRAETVVLDLNPRSLSVWILTIGRRVRQQRTLHWGHLYPRAGSLSRSAFLRRGLRHLSSGTILYGYDSAEPAQQDIPGLPVWVAPNALYPESMMGPEDSKRERYRLIYVGRLVADKKVDLLVRAFARSEAAKDGCRLTIVGSGVDLASLQQLAADTHCADRVEFL